MSNKKRKVVTSRQGRIHSIAHCEKCDWVEEDMHKAKYEARKHCAATGHSISIEDGIWLRVTPRENVA